MRKYLGPSLVLVDQIASSGANLAFVIVVSNVASAGDFGIFSVLFSVYFLTLGLSRSFATDVLIFNRVPDALRQKSSSSMFSANLLAGFAVGSAILLPLPFLDAHTSKLLLAFAASLPFLIGIDALRVSGIVARDYGHVLLIDSSWLALQFVPSIALFAVGALTPPLAIALWGASAALVVTFYATRRKVAVSTRQGLRWVWRLKREGGALALDFLAGQGVLQLSILVLAVVASPVAAGPVRLVQSAMGLVSVGVQGAQSFIAPRMSSTAGLKTPRFAMSVGALLAMVAALWGLCLVIASGPFGEQVFGETWSLVTITLIAIFTIEKALATFAAPFTWLLRARGHAVRLAAVRGLAGSVTLTLSALGAWTFGARGVATGLAVGTTITSLAILRSATRRRTRDHVEERLVNDGR